MHASFILLFELYIDTKDYCDRMTILAFYVTRTTLTRSFLVTGAFGMHSVYIMHLLTVVLGFYSVQTVFCHRHLPGIPRKPTH